MPLTVEQGRTLVPLRAIFEALGADVNWDAATQTVTGTKGATIVKLTIGSTIAYVSGQAVPLDVPGKILNGRTLVPLRFISESLGAEVVYDNSRITIRSGDATFVSPDPTVGVKVHFIRRLGRRNLHRTAKRGGHPD
ncbi:copper amine oxidase N-terminal domain-containing protein [Neomoorella humiferrea]